MSATLPEFGVPPQERLVPARRISRHLNALLLPWHSAGLPWERWPKPPPIHWYEMGGKFLIDLTDPRFRVVANEDVLEFVRRTNPFAHSDVGSLLLELGKWVAGARAYSPSYRQYAYVVLHTDAWRIFAIAFGQRGLAFRLTAISRAEALGEGGVAAPAIGPDWVAFDPWDVSTRTGDVRIRLQRWCAQAFADAMVST